MGCLHDVFKCVIVVFCIGNIAFLNEQSYTVGYTPSNKIFTLKALNMQCCAFCLMTLKIETPFVTTHDIFKKRVPLKHTMAMEKGHSWEMWPYFISFIFN